MLRWCTDTGYHGPHFGMWASLVFFDEVVEFWQVIVGGDEGPSNKSAKFVA